MLMDEFGKMYTAIERFKKEIVHEFHTVVEGLRHDDLGIIKDQTQGHEDRIVRLERHSGLVRR